MFVIICYKIQIRSNTCIRIWEPSHYPSVRGEKRARLNFLVLRELLATLIICSIDIICYFKRYLLKTNRWISISSWWIRKPLPSCTDFAPVSCIVILLSSGRHRRKEGHCMLWNLSCSPALIGSFFLACVIPISCLSWHVCTRVVPAVYLAPVCAVAELDQPKPICNTFFLWLDWPWE